MNDFDKTVSFGGGMYGNREGAKITIFDGTFGPVTYDLNSFRKEAITFGREAGNDIVLRSHFVSKKHGQFRLVNGMCIIEDLGSTNGLYINGMPVKSYGLRLLLCVHSVVLFIKLTNLHKKFRIHKWIIGIRNANAPAVSKPQNGIKVCYETSNIIINVYSADSSSG